MELPEHDFLMVRLHKRISARGIGDFLSQLFYSCDFYKERYLCNLEGGWSLRFLFWRKLSTFSWKLISMIAWEDLISAIFIWWVDLCAIVGELISTTLEERGIYIYDFFLTPRKQVCDPDEWIHHLNSMRSESGMISCMIAWFTYISVVPLPCYRTLNVVGDFPAFVTELVLDLSPGGMCIQKDCTQERYISEIYYWRFWGMASKKNNLLIDLLFCIFLHSYWGICYAWQSRLMG